MRQAYDYWQNQPGNFLEGSPEATQTARGRQSSSLRGDRGHSEPHPGAEATTGLTRYPIAPTMFPTGRSPAHWLAIARCEMCPAGGGYHSPVTSEDGYQLRLTPNCLRINVDHRPVIHRLQQSLPAGADRSSGASTGLPVLRGSFCFSSFVPPLSRTSWARAHTDKSTAIDGGHTIMVHQNNTLVLHYHPIRHAYFACAIKQR